MDRFWSKVNKHSGVFYAGDRTECWLWTAGTFTSGYGSFFVDGRDVRAHCFAFGPVEDGLELDHLCRHITCVRKSHLEAVTHAENMRRAMKTHCLRGHLYDEANTYVQPNGTRECRTCRKQRREPKNA